MKKKGNLYYLSRFLGVELQGANTAEAYGAISTADFSAKISIAYKECQETQYWLLLLQKTAYIEDNIAESLMADAEEIGKILFAILYKTRINKPK